MVTPRQPSIATHGGDQLVFVMKQCRYHRRAAGHVGWRLLDGQGQSLLFGKTERTVVVNHVAGCYLGAEPFSQQPWMTAGSLSQHLGCHGLAIGHGPIQPQLIAQDHVGQCRRRAHVAHQLAHELVKSCLVHDLPSSARRPPSATSGPGGGGRMDDCRACAKQARALSLDEHGTCHRRHRRLGLTAWHRPVSPPMPWPAPCRRTGSVR